MTKGELDLFAQIIREGVMSTKYLSDRDKIKVLVSIEEKATGLLKAHGISKLELKRFQKKVLGL